MCALSSLRENDTTQYHVAPIPLREFRSQYGHKLYLETDRSRFQVCAEESSIFVRHFRKGRTWSKVDISYLDSAIVIHHLNAQPILTLRCRFWIQVTRLRPG